MSGKPGIFESDEDNFERDYFVVSVYGCIEWISPVSITAFRNHSFPVTDVMLALAAPRQDVVVIPVWKGSIFHEVFLVEDAQRPRIDAAGGDMLMPAVGVRLKVVLVRDLEFLHSVFAVELDGYTVSAWEHSSDRFVAPDLLGIAGICHQGAFAQGDEVVQPVHYCLRLAAVYGS